MSTATLDQAVVPELVPVSTVRTALPIGTYQVVPIEVAFK